MQITTNLSKNFLILVDMTKKNIVVGGNISGGQKLKNLKNLAKLKNLVNLSKSQNTNTINVKALSFLTSKAIIVFTKLKQKP